MTVPVGCAGAAGAGTAAGTVYCTGSMAGIGSPPLAEVPCLGLKNRRRRALLTTNTELKLMARAATMGFIFRLNAAYQHPAAMGIPMTL